MTEEQRQELFEKICDLVLAETGCQNEEHIMAASAAVDVLGVLLPN